MQVAMSIEPVEASHEDAETSLRVVFRGAFKLMLRHVFGHLRQRLFKDFSIVDNITPTIVNGKCYRSMTVQIEKPDLYRLGLAEWPLMIKSMMERTFRVQVTFFESYERFLNA